MNMLTTMITGRTNYRSEQRKVKKHTQELNEISSKMLPSNITRPPQNSKVTYKVPLKKT